MASAIDINSHTARPSHRPPPEWGALEALALPSVTLDPGNVTNIEHFEQHSGYVQPAVDALKLAHESVARVIAARQAVAKNTAWSLDRRVLEVGMVAEKLSDKVLRALDGAAQRLTQGINSIESSLNSPLTSSNSPSDAEIRKYVSELSDERRITFLQERVTQRDTRTLSAVLSMPSYLSGLKDEMAQIFLRQYHSITAPQIVQRLSVMKTALERLERVSSNLVMNQFAEAVGYRWERFNHIKARAKAAADSLLTD